jgi:hydrogenase maturation protease
VTSSALLVVCIGNPLRGDDGLGLAVGKALVARGLPAEAIRIVAGLVPELAPEVATADAVAFVDASATLAPGEMHVERLSADTESPRWTHHMDPASLLALAQAAYGRVPSETLFTMGGRAWGVGEAMSAEVEVRVPELADLVLRAATDLVEACGHA